MKKIWSTPKMSRFGSVAQMTLASEQPNSGKCPDVGDDALCAPPGREGCDPMGCPGDGVRS